MASEQIGRYRILDTLGQGGMGKVYRAHDPDLNRPVVLKLITLPDSADRAEWTQRFKREVQAAARLNHRHIVTVHDVGLEHDPPYLVMELLPSGSLKERLNQQPLPWREALALLRPLAESLAFAHQAGIIHRDVKPANVMFSQDGTLKLVDFGLARQQEEVEQVTQAGGVLGTPGYMAPEQAYGQELDGRADIFAFGIILLEAITGRNPLGKGSVISTLTETISPAPVDLSALPNDTPAAVVGLIERAVTKDPAQRYPTCEALIADLDQCLARPDSMLPTAAEAPAPTVAPARPARPKQWLWLGGGLVAILGLVVVLAGGGAALWYFAFARSGPQPEIATVIGVKPTAELRQGHSSRLKPVTLRMPLRQGDIVNTYEGASVSIACYDGPIFSLPEQSNLTVNCHNTDDPRVVGVLDPTLSRQLVGISASASVTLDPNTTRGSRAEQDKLPLLLTPRNSVITATRPIFHWQPVAGASGYRLTVNLAGGQSWSEETAETSLPYPAEAPPLPFDSANIVQISTLEDESVVDKTLLRLPAEGELEALAEAEVEIQNLPLDEAARRFLLAQLYRQHELWAAAIEQLQHIAQSEETPSAGLRQQLGDLFLEVGLFSQAEEQYQVVLAAAEAGDDAEALAAAHVGLARTANAFAELNQAITHLTTAETLYREAGQTEQADQIAAERAKLEP